MGLRGQSRHPSAGCGRVGASAEPGSAQRSAGRYRAAGGHRHRLAAAPGLRTHQVGRQLGAHQDRRRPRAAPGPVAVGDHDRPPPKPRRCWRGSDCTPQTRIWAARGLDGHRGPRCATRARSPTPTPAETTFTAFASTKHPVTARQLVRRVCDRTNLQELFPAWRHAHSSPTATSRAPRRRHPDQRQACRGAWRDASPPDHHRPGTDRPPATPPFQPTARADIWRTLWHNVSWPETDPPATALP